MMHNVVDLLIFRKLLSLFSEEEIIRHCHLRLMTTLFEILFDNIIRDSIIGDIADLVLSSDNRWLVVSRVAVIKNLNLSSNQEKADKKIILSCANFIPKNQLWA